MIESAHQFGTDGRLTGVLTLPPDGEPVRSVLILISAGFTHKVGPYRLYAELARSIALSGAATLRFDLGGIGNSEVLDPGLPLPVRTIDDIRDAVDFVSERLGTEKIVVGGLCSGAEDAFRYASEDERVAGVLMIDPHAYRTPMWWVRNIFSEMFVCRVIYKIMRVFRIINVAKKSPGSVRAEGFEGDLVNYQYMNIDEVSRVLADLNNREVPYHYIYTGGMIDVINHRKQFYRMLKQVKFCGLETVTHLPHIEHIQVFAEDRKQLVDVVCKWMNDKFNRPNTSAQVCAKAGVRPGLLSAHDHVKAPAYPRAPTQNPGRGAQGSQRYPH